MTRLAGQLGAGSVTRGVRGCALEREDTRAVVGDTAALQLDCQWLG